MLAQIYNQIDTAIKWVDDRIWGLPLIILILTTGIYLTVRLGGLQIRHLPKALRFMVKNEEEGHGEVTSFGALCTALSATIGTGNITGVATAIAAGGPGALFWMVVAAFFGMATKYAEGLLAIKYRTIDKEGHVLGGPFYYIENGMGKNWRWLAKIFAFFGAGVGLFGIGTFTQVNSIASAVKNFFDPNTENAVQMFGNTYSWATVITCINEAGLGSAPIAAAAAVTKEPVRQGLVSMTGTFIDTIIICTMTGISVVLAGTWNDPNLEGVEITMAAFQKGLPFAPVVASFILMLCLVFFAFTTILGWNYYGERCMEYLFNRNKKVVMTYRWLYILAVFIGPYMTVAAVWNIADIFNALMALPNLIALLVLSNVVVKETKDYFARMK